MLVDGCRQFGTLRFGFICSLKGLGIHFDPFRETALLSRSKCSLDTQLRLGLFDAR